MKETFSKHPLFYTCFLSCFTLILIGGGVATLLGLVTYKAVKSLGDLSETSASASSPDYTYIYGTEASENKLLSIPINGIILTTGESADPLTLLFETNATFGYTVRKHIMDAASDDAIKGIILEIDSPGGTIGGANAISQAVAAYQSQTSKPVIAHINGLGASGAYWVAAAAEQIYTEPGSLTGSIGVIMGPFKYYNGVLSENDLYSSVVTENGIQSFNIYAGTDKDLGFPYKQLSTKARDTLQKGVDEEYEKFVTHVSDRRKIALDKIKTEIGGLIYSNDQAFNLQLTDGEHTLDTSYTKLAEMAQIEGTDFQVVTTGETGFWSSLFRSFLTDKADLKAQKTCYLCNQMLYLHGNPEDF